MDNLEQAKKFAEIGPMTERRASMFALIDIAESLRAMQPTVRQVDRGPVVYKDFSGRDVWTGDRAALPGDHAQVMNLSDFALEHVGGVDDE